MESLVLFFLDLFMRNARLARDQRRGGREEQLPVHLDDGVGGFHASVPA